MRNFIALIIISIGIYFFYIDQKAFGFGFLVAGYFFADVTNSFNSSERDDPGRRYPNDRDNYPDGTDKGM